MKKTFLLDSTLRDGSYVINYQFTLEQVRGIAKGLENAGVDFIEVCNGNGIGAVEAFPMLKGLHSDVEYVSAARAAIQGRSKLGVIGAPWFLRDELMAPLWEHIDFVRLGVNLFDLSGTSEWVRKVKEHGKLCFIQLMRSSQVSLDHLVKVAVELKDCGADVLYVVDTAGLMTPEVVGVAVKRLIEDTAAPIGFHGHNHLQLAVANTLAAFQNGATFLDGCLLTMGRGAGNAQTEILAKFLNDQNARAFELDTLIDTAEQWVKPLLRDVPAGTSAHALRNAFHRVDVPVEIVAQIAKKTNSTPAEVLAQFGQIPDFFEVSEENIKGVLQHMMNLRRLPRCA